MSTSKEAAPTLIPIEQKEENKSKEKIENLKAKKESSKSKISE